MSNQTYKDRLNTYIANYESAVAKIEQINNNLNILYQSFNGASGVDIIKIRTDIESIVADNNSFKNTIISKKNNALANANAYDDVYIEWKNKIGQKEVQYEPENGTSSPSGTPFKRVMSIIKKVSICKDGNIRVEKHKTTEIRKVYSSGNAYVGIQSSPVNAKYLFEASTSSALLKYEIVSQTTEKKYFLVDPNGGFGPYREYTIITQEDLNAIISGQNQ